MSYSSGSASFSTSLRVEIQRIDSDLQILHGELEASLRAAQAELAFTESELEKQRTLNEKLETDLLQMDQRKLNGELNGVADYESSRADSPQLDALAGLDLGKKPNVSVGRVMVAVHDYKEWPLNI